MHWLTAVTTLPLLRTISTSGPGCHLRRHRRFRAAGRVRAATKLLGALQVPFVAIPGNHDRRPLIRETFPDPAYGTADCALNTLRRIDGLDILLIDSNVAGAPHGELDALTLSWLDDWCVDHTTCAPLFASSSVRHWNCVHRRRAAPKLRRACRSSWTTPVAMFIVRPKLCSRAFRPVSARGRAGGYPRIRTTLAGGFQNRASNLPFARMASRTGIRKRGYSPRAGRGVSRALFLRLRRNDPSPAVRPNFWAKRPLFLR